ncbi:MAG TPA: winged helix-turn-helix domain-containing protein [Thermoplasmata archaeon]|nr:winged helix-turn-helix domain-containing protein [Thermoplasmata archaeon]
MRTPMLPAPSTITLDQESFKALASEVRVDILKRLDERRQTVTDLSSLLSLSKPTLLEHLEKLQTAGLVKRVDEGRKWIYYELTAKGRKLLHPEKVAIVLALSSAIALVAIGIFLLLFASPGGLFAAPANNYMGSPIAGPAADRSVLGLPNAFAAGALVAFILALASVVLAAVFVWLGRRRRERFFSELAGSQS